MSVENRVKELLGRLTLVDKVAQMTQCNLEHLVIANGAVTSESLEKLFGGACVGIICVSPRDDIRTSVLKVNAAQDYLLKKTKTAIPALVASESLHGVVVRGATIFPQALALGATWSVEIVRELGAAIAAEATALGIVQCLSPVLDLARDPRYGRVEECFGECPYLVGRMGIAYIRGMQGKHSEQAIAPNKVICTAKHFAGYSVPQNGINIAPSAMGERTMRALHLAPFEVAIKEGDLGGIMPAYNEIDGIPLHANQWLLTKVLREEWKFNGFVCSDWGAIDMIASLHKTAANKAEAALAALNAGVDIEAPSPDCYAGLAALAEEGKASKAAIDAAASRVLRAKVLAGLFDGVRSTVDPTAVATKVRPGHHVALARRVAAESVVLLKNSGGVLPLTPARFKNIAVIGPNADQVQFGDYSWSKSNADGVTVFQGIKALGLENVNVAHARGCDIVSHSLSGFGEAVELAKRSDVAIVVVGDTSAVLGAEMNTPDGLATVGEGFDVTDPVLPGVQLELVKSIHATGVPTVVVMLHGRPYSVPWIKEHVPAILDAFYPGEQQGAAIADVLFGKVNPSGRLPVTVAQSAGHIPTTYDYKPSGRGYYHRPGSADKPGRDYVFSSPAPLWPFGHGLSYTKFEYKDLRFDAPKVKFVGTIKFSFVLGNVGEVTGKEVVQVYYRDPVSSTTTPVMRLIRFEKVELKPRDKATLSFEINPVELSVWNREMKNVVEPGVFEFMIGASADDIKLKGAVELVVK